VNRLEALQVIEASPQGPELFRRGLVRPLRVDQVSVRRGREGNFLNPRENLAKVQPAIRRQAAGRRGGDSEFGLWRRYRPR
jgi:hypothetical protein